MENDLPKIKFVYSPIYDALLSEYEGKYFHEKQKREIIEFIKKLRKEWRKIKKPVLKFLLKIFQNDCGKREIICYIVKYLKFSGISHPLTIKMTKNIPEAIINLIHEFIHLFLSLKKWKRTSQKLLKKFPHEKPEIILRIYINLIQLQILKKFFKKPVIKKMLKKYKKLKRTGRAWEIVLIEEEALHKLLKSKLNF